MIGGDHLVTGGEGQGAQHRVDAVGGVGNRGQASGIGADESGQRGAGMPVLQGRGRGDLVIEIAVETPTRISKEQRALLEQFRELETGDECPESRGFFDKLKGALGG